MIWVKVRLRIPQIELYEIFLNSKQSLGFNEFQESDRVIVITISSHRYRLVRKGKLLDCLPNVTERHLN